jgi:hypothetical protein
MRARLVIVSLGAIGVMLLQGSALAAGPKLHSLYTSLQKCKAVKKLELPERTLEQGAGTGISRCRGVNGYSVYVIDEDPRSWLVLERSKKLAPLDRQMVREFKLGNFPNVAPAKNAEWRVDRKGKASGLIVRVFYQRNDVSANSPASQVSTLFAFQVKNEQPVFLGVAANNAEARKLVDEADH